MRLIPKLLAACMLTCSSVGSAAVLQVASNGILTGATGVNVDGALYDVSFVDGTCVEIFAGCDSNNDFLFNTFVSSTLASLALSQQVFLDGSLGNFDSLPGLTKGCLSESICYAWTPFGVGFNGVLSSKYFANVTDEFNDSIGTAASDNTENLAPLPNRADRAVWAKWTPAVVPEPASVALIAAGLLGLWFAQRDRKPRAR
jgi:hypothetical protein